jgi:glycosyltransferase involved in cell wall biosynthesis
MRIAYVTSTLPFGSGEAFVIPELRALERLGHEVWLVPMRPQSSQVMHDDARPLLARTLAAPVLSPAIVASAAAETVRAPGKVGRALAPVGSSRNARILAKNLLIAPKALWLARRLRELRIEHVHAHWGSTSATLAMVASELAGLPWSFTAHRWDIAEDNLLARKARSASFVRAISADGLADLQRRVGDGSPTALIHMGVDLPAWDERPALPAAGALRVLVPASLVEVKGHAPFLHAVGDLRSRGIVIRVELAGDGPLRSELEALATQLGLSDAVRFLGVLSHTELLKRLQRGAWDLVVIPSVPTPSGEKEGIPVALVEAMACGVPVVASALGGIPELLDGGGGVLVPPGQPELLADAVERLDAEPDLRRDFARRGRERVERFFRADVIANELATRFAESTTRTPA